MFLVARLYPVFWEGFSIPDSSVNMIVLIAAAADPGNLKAFESQQGKVFAFRVTGTVAGQPLTAKVVNPDGFPVAGHDVTTAELEITQRGRDVAQETFLRLCREPAIATDR